MARILLGVTGGIAAYKALELVRLATGAGHSVRVIQTDASQRFVGAASFAALTGAPVLTDEWERDPARGAFPDQQAPAHDPLSHLELVANADVFVVAPAGANSLAKLAHGLADNLLSSAALAATCPLVIAPAMNVRMWEHPATRTNLALLAERGAHVVAPSEGRLGSIGEWGMGRLAEPAAILAATEAALVPELDASRWAGVRVLVTAGGTREPIDAVRFVGNRSSGRMGFALASAAADRGARVTVVAANVGLPRDPRVEYVDVATAAELQAACEAAFGDCAVLLMAAAVADFRPADPEPAKLKKSGRDELVVRMEPTDDVLGGLSAKRRPGQLLVGFAAETGSGALEYGREKLHRKGLDAIVVNDVAAPGVGFEGEENEVTILTSDGDHHVERSAKPRVASAILSVVESLRETTTTPTPAVTAVDPDAGRVEPGEVEAAVRFASSLKVAVSRAVEVREGLLDELLVCIVAEGHILIEDLPGVGKTTLARALARAVGLELSRIQCTSDLLPADVVGANIYNRREERFEFRPGPVFANVVLVDEINRASPKTQSGLLECMQERRVTVDVHTHELARPFVVLATQNPVEFEGTYPLPEAQVDRFMARVTLGYPSPAAEAEMLRGHESRDLTESVEAVGGPADLLGAQDAARRVHTSDALRRYVVDLLGATRADPRSELGASPRAGLMLLRAAKARALLSGRDHALPDDVQALARLVLGHRVVPIAEALEATGEAIVSDALAAVPAL